VFHVELRRFPHVARAFNLTRKELDERIVRPWVGGVPVELDDRAWEPAKARLSIYEGPQVEPEQMGLGRGWASATRAGAEVTARVLEEARASVQRFKDALTRRMTLTDIVALAAEWHPEARVSEHLALAERAVWELLHEGRISLLGPAGSVGRDAWAATLLDWATWREGTVAIEPRP
jgi:hypothetical protein